MSHLASVRLRLVLAGMFVLVCCAVGLALWARQVVEQSRERISAIRETVVNESAQQRAGTPDDSPAVGPAREVIRQTCTQLGDLERDLKPVAELASVAAPASGLIGQIPQVGERAAALLTLAQAAGDISGSLRLGCDALEPVVQAQAASSDTASLVESLVAGLGASRDQLREASARLRLAQGRLTAVDERQLDEPTRRFLVDLRTRLPSATARLELAAELPSLLGHDGPRTFLILGQNSDELRPTGGFIGTSGLMTFDRGRLTWKEYGSSFGLNVPADRLVRPPEPLRQYMGAGYWHLQEANWWPDFPSSAQQARYFYNVVRDGQLAGVFALDQDLMVLLVGVTGPIDVPEYGEVVSADNVRERLDYHVHVVGAGPEKSRKGFVSSLFSALIDRLNTLPRDRARVLTAALDRGLAEQHLLLWADDPDAQQPIAALGWDGRMLSTSGDYLFPVSANVGMNKVNREVEQDLAYDISQDFDGRLVGHASLRIGNRRASDDPGPYATADYRDFFRLYVPAQSELVSAAGFAAEPQAEIECGRTVFSGLVVVRPGEERRVELVYRLPAMLDPSAYSLVIQKQPGTSAFPVRLRGLGIPAGDLAFQLAGSQRLRATGGQLSAASLGPTGEVDQPEPSCRIQTDPPRQLHPPSELAIPRFDVHAPVLGLGVEPDGTLESPTTGTVVGWYSESARPGQVGNMVVSGHVDWDRRPGVFWSLRQLRPGDQIEIAAEGGERYVYQVEWVTNFSPKDAPLKEILGPTTQRWLTLITCGGVFDQRTRDYSERVVARAKLREGDDSITVAK